MLPSPEPVRMGTLAPPAGQGCSPSGSDGSERVRAGPGGECRAEFCKVLFQGVHLGVVAPVPDRPRERAKFGLFKRLNRESPRGNSLRDVRLCLGEKFSKAEERLWIC